MDFILGCSKRGFSKKELKLIKSALLKIKEEIGDKRRLSGDTFFDHNVRVAQILLDIGATFEVVLAGLLHKTKVANELGLEVNKLLEGFLDIKKIKYHSKALEAEAIRKILFTTLRDVRIIIVKLADKLDNLKSIECLSKLEQNKIAQEVLDIYSPLAYRLGLEKIRCELEDLSLKVLHPKKYNEISKFLEQSQEDREINVKETIRLISNLAKNKAEIVKIKGRPKHVYSIYKKILKGKNLREIYDLLGIRIIVKNERDCYTILGLLHEKFEPIDGRLKDYILNPKQNGYQSIHTGVKLPNNKILEVQIRTVQMEEVAEEGFAAHWQYKDIKSEQDFEKKVSWLKGILNLQKELGVKEFIETAKVDVFGDEIYCYTPKGDVKRLPKHATILDFAYSIHEEIGNKSVGARVNGKFVSLKHSLNLGDVVEIITHKHQRPRRSWLKIVTSGKAKQKIRKILKKYEKLPALHYRKIKPKIVEEGGVLVESISFPQAICNIAKCCQPIPDEKIIGIMTKRRIISVHREECELAEKEKDRWIDVNWKDTFNQKIQFFVLANERSGLLADLLHTIVSAGFEVKEARAKLVGAGKAECLFVVIPRDLEHLKKLIERIRKVKGTGKISFS